ncbi:hypothetical protein Taro_002478 [Colocasia esculenta]|uniref:Uncharacterized protein n=1 Tax=Colocasia esculenta TaxID=4460 RepID=A0A843TE73_COLES|nr:hypothetical protein [Colocasia esculenta]
MSATPSPSLSSSSLSPLLWWWRGSPPAIGAWWHRRARGSVLARSWREEEVANRREGPLVGSFFMKDSFTAFPMLPSPVCACVWFVGNPGIKDPVGLPPYWCRDCTVRRDISRAVAPIGRDLIAAHLAVAIRVPIATYFPIAIRRLLRRAAPSHQVYCGGAFPCRDGIATACGGVTMLVLPRVVSLAVTEGDTFVAVSWQRCQEGHRYPGYECARVGSPHERTLELRGKRGIRPQLRQAAALSHPCAGAEAGARLTSRACGLRVPLLAASGGGLVAVVVTAFSSRCSLVFLTCASGGSRFSVLSVPWSHSWVPSCDGTGVCSFLTWRCVRGPGWFYLWALDLVEFLLLWPVRDWLQLLLCRVRGKCGRSACSCCSGAVGAGLAGSGIPCMEDACEPVLMRCSCSSSAHLGVCVPLRLRELACCMAFTGVGLWPMELVEGVSALLAAPFLALTGCELCWGAPRVLLCWFWLRCIACLPYDLVENGALVVLVENGALVVLVEVLPGLACVASAVLLAVVFSLMVRIVWIVHSGEGSSQDRRLSLLAEVLPRSALCSFRATVVLPLWAGADVACCALSGLQFLARAFGIPIGGRRVVLDLCGCYGFRVVVHGVGESGSQWWSLLSVRLVIVRLIGLLVLGHVACRHFLWLHVRLVSLLDHKEATVHSVRVGCWSAGPNRGVYWWLQPYSFDWRLLLFILDLASLGISGVVVPFGRPTCGWSEPSVPQLGAPGALEHVGGPSRSGCRGLKAQVGYPFPLSFLFFSFPSSPAVERLPSGDRSMVAPAGSWRHRGACVERGGDSFTAFPMLPSPVCACVWFVGDPGIEDLVGLPPCWCRDCTVRRDISRAATPVGRDLIAAHLAVTIRVATHASGGSRFGVLLVPWSHSLVPARDGTGVCSFLTWRCVRGPGWFCLLALDLVEV